MDYKHFRRENFRGKLINEIFYFRQIDSTNSYSRRNFKELRNGNLIIAENQTSGRGQRGRPWESNQNLGLYFSLVLKTRLDLGQLNFLTSLAGTSLNKVFRGLGLDTLIKKPNDIYIGGKKLAGILVENMETSLAYFTIIGIGINVNQAPSDFGEDICSTATSLASSLNRQLDLGNLLQLLLEQLDQDIYTYFKGLDRTKVLAYIEKYEYKKDKP